MSSLVHPSGDGNIRPVGQAVFGLYKLWAQAIPERWHMLGLTLHLANSLLIAWLALRLTRLRSAALAACFLFALGASHTEPVAWVAATFDLLAVFFCLLTLLCIAAREHRWLVWSVPFTALAVLSKESAYVLPLVALLILAAFKLLTRRRLKYLAAGFAVCVWLFVNRTMVFGGPGGYVDPATGKAQILSVTPFSAVNALIYRPWRTLIAPVNLESADRLTLGISALAIVGFACIAALSRFPRRARLFLLPAVSISLLPAVHVSLIRPDLLGTRVFYFASVSFAILIAELLVSIERRSAQRIAVLAFGLASVYLLWVNLEIRSRVAQVGGQLCSELARAAGKDHAVTVTGVPVTLHGNYFFGNGLEQCVEDKTGRPVSRTRTGKVFTWTEASGLQQVH